MLEYGQGVLGMQRAFQTAGARSVIASLWRVDDAATAVLMERFYTNLWTRKLSKMEALRRAQLDVLNDPSLVDARRARLAPRGISGIVEALPGGARAGLPRPGGARALIPRCGLRSSSAAPAPEPISSSARKSRAQTEEF